MAADPDQIRRRIERTRDALSANVNALTEKVTPSRAMARQVDRTRHTMTNVKDKIMVPPKTRRPPQPTPRQPLAKRPARSLRPRLTRCRRWRRARSTR